MNELRPVEKHFLYCFYRKSPMKSDEAISLVIYWLYNNGFVAIDKKDKTITASDKNDHNWPVLRNYEYLILKAIATSYSVGLVQAVENYNFAADLERMGYLVPKMNIFQNPCTPSFSLTEKGAAEVEFQKMTPPLRFRIPPEIVVYVDISIKIDVQKMLSYRPAARV